MTQPQLRDLVKASNPVVTQQLLSDERAVRTLYAEAMQRADNPQSSADLLEQPVERRRDMQTQEKPTQVIGKPKAIRPKRRLMPALAGALAVIVIAVGVWALTSNPEPEFADRSPLQVMDAFEETVVAGDWVGAADLYTADATYKFIFPDGESPDIRFADEVPPQADVQDWDEDGVVTERDGFTWFGAEIYAGGVTGFLSCTQSDAVTAVCSEVREGYAFKNETHSANWTITIADGLISSLVIELEGNGQDPTAAAQFRRWVTENRPELVEDLFDFSGQRDITLENVDTHRELVAEWQAAQ